MERKIKTNNIKTPNQTALLKLMPSVIKPHRGFLKAKKNTIKIYIFGLNKNYKKNLYNNIIIIIVSHKIQG
jgi:hypothetical protein